MEKISFYTLDEVKDKQLGKIGTTHRDQYEAELNSFLMGEAIKKARLEKHLTQEELGKMIGVKKAQVSRMENGANLSFSAIARVFKAMKISASFNMQGIGQVALW